MVSIIFRESFNKENGANFTTLGRPGRGLWVTLRAMGGDLGPLPSFHSGISTVNWTSFREGNGRGLWEHVAPLFDQGVDRSLPPSEVLGHVEPEVPVSSEHDQCGPGPQDSGELQVLNFARLIKRDFQRPLF